MDIFGLDNINGVLDASLDVLRCEVRVIVADDCVKRNALAHKFKDVLNGDASAGHTRLSKMDIGSDRDSISHRFPPAAWMYLTSNTVVSIHAHGFPAIQTMEPHDELADSMNVDPFVFAAPGRCTVVYVMAGGTFTLDLSAGEGRAVVRWFNPRDGNFGEPFIVAGGGRCEFAAPDLNDRVLLVKEGLGPQ